MSETREKVTAQLLAYATRELEACAVARRNAYEMRLLWQESAKESAVVRALSGEPSDEDSRECGRIVRRRMDEAEGAVAWYAEMGAAWAEILALLMTRDRKETAGE